MQDVTEQFRDAIKSAGLTPPGKIEADGKLHRFASNSKRDDDAGWYALHGDGIPAGSFGDWRTGIHETWRADIGRKLTSAEDAAHRAKVEATQREREAEKARVQAEAAKKARAIWEAAKPAPADHTYLARKGIKPSGARLHNDELLIPLRAGGKIHSVQFIGADGEKRFLPGGRVAGCYFSIGNPTGAANLCIAEGLATAATIHEATGYPVAVAFNAGNLGPVATTMRQRFADLPLIICADDDAATAGNPGITKATEAARSVGGLVAIPDFGDARPEDATDFNDLAKQYGLEAVKRAIANAVTPAEGEAQPDTGGATCGAPDSKGWGEPQPLTVKVEAEPYPLDALPDSIRAAVIEVQGFTKAPIPMMASSALAALSLAIQAHVDVRRADKLSGPSGLFLLTIADSGERKSTCDGFFTKAIQEYEAQQAELAKPILRDYMAKIGAWEAKHAGVKDNIRQQAKAGKSTAGAEKDLRDLEGNKPVPPRVPHLLYADATPEALAHALANKWPSGGVVSAEGGAVLGSHAMGKDSVMRNLAMLNQLWDGNALTIDRRTTESFTVRGARLTVALQVQEPTLREFFSRTGALARGSGFLARFLPSWPESTQGFRPFTEAPRDWPHLAAFNRRIAAILNQPAPIDANGSLTPAMLSMTAETKAAWVAYHDAIEGELASGGELYDVRDVASKSADNAARLAALIHVFSSKNSNNSGSNIQVEEIESACRIAAWHLNESRRFFGELALPVELVDAARLDTWLLEHCRRERTHMVKKNYVRQHGPLRDGERLAAAIRELGDFDRLRLVKEGKKLTIHANPALLIEVAS